MAAKQHLAAASQTAHVVVSMGPLPPPLVPPALVPPVPAIFPAPPVPSPPLSDEPHATLSKPITNASGKILTIVVNQALQHPILRSTWNHMIHVGKYGFTRAIPGGRKRGSA